MNCLWLRSHKAYVRAMLRAAILFILFFIFSMYTLQRQLKSIKKIIIADFAKQVFKKAGF
jgi:hypothetical protein